MDFTGQFPGIIEDTADPEKLGRARIRVPQLHGIAGRGVIASNSLPWAVPAALPAGSGGGISWPPEVGDNVWVTFLDGEPEKPVWRYGMQDTSQAKLYPLHSYDKDSVPNCGTLQRYGHRFELNKDAAVLHTKGRLSLAFNDTIRSTALDAGDELHVCATRLTRLNTTVLAISIANGVISVDNELAITANGAVTILSTGCTHRISDGAVLISDQAGSSLGLDGLGNAMLLASNGSGLLIGNEAGSLTLSSGVQLSALGPVAALSALELAVNAGAINLGLGAVDPIVTTYRLILYLTELCALYAAHVHPLPDGGTTGPPTVLLVPPLPIQIGSLTTTAV